MRHEGHGDHRGRGGGVHGHVEMLRTWVWRDFVNIILGFWLLTAPVTLGYFATSPRLAWSDTLTGAAVVVMASLTLIPRFDPLRWGVCAAGGWLLLAPLVFWTPSAGAYASDTLVGSLLIAFSVLIPMMPGRAHHEVMMAPGPEVPPGWAYNPSDWTQRGPLIAMAFVGFFISRYLAAYQLGHTGRAWDPFFGDGTRRVLESDVSRAWPISDAGLGAVSYMLEALSGFMGGRSRWRTMPWMVLMFGFLVIPLGIVSIMLVILQPVAVGAWCTLCLITAAAMLIMISPALDEVVAMSQFMRRAKRAGKPLWRTFWVGGTLEASAEDERLAGRSRAQSGPMWRRVVAALDLNNVPWTMLACAAIGVWLMSAPGVLGHGGAAAKNDQLIGSLVVTFSVIAFSEIARPARLINIPLALWLAVGAFVLEGGGAVPLWNALVAAALLIALSLRRGKIEERFGAWNRVLI